MKTKLFITALALMVTTALVSAQNKATDQKQQNNRGNDIAWVDANNDGICDNLGTPGSGAAKGNRSGSGYMRGAGQGQRMGLGQRGTGQGRGYNRNFVDADKDGICDVRKAPAKK